MGTPAESTPFLKPESSVQSAETYQAKQKPVTVHEHTETGWKYRIPGDASSGPADLPQEPDNVPPVGTLSAEIAAEQEAEDKAQESKGEEAAAQVAADVEDAKAAETTEEAQASA